MQDQAFSLIFHEHGSMITAYLYTLVGDWGEAADLAQDTFVIAYRKMDTFDPSRPVSAWLRGIARNIARNALRKRSRERLFLVEGDVIEETFSAVDTGGSESGWEEHLSKLDGCVGRLPVNQKKAVELYYQNGETTDKVSALLGILDRSVYQLLWQARKTLKKCLATLLRAEEPAHGS